MEPVLFGLALAAGAAAVGWWAGRNSIGGRPDGDAGARIRDAGDALHALERDSTVVIDVAADDPDDPRVERLVRAAAMKVFEAEARVHVVTVKNRDGAVLGRVPRTPPPLRDVPTPQIPHAQPRRDHTPSPVPHEQEPLRTRPVDTGPVEAVHRELAETFELPDEVLALLDDHVDAVGLVAAILAAGGRDVQRHDDVVQVDDHAFVIVDGHGRSVLGDALSRAYLHFQATKAAHGAVIVFGFIDPSELRRRQALAPQLSYVGRDAVQRMADAVALGADPLEFVTEPAVQITEG